MELNVEILAHFLAQEKAQIIFPELKLTATEIVELQCYQTLLRIRNVLRNDTLEDKECFESIERIICEFEAIGCNVGNRHDFG